MPAELRLDRSGDLARLQCQGGRDEVRIELRLELRHGERAQAPALRRGLLVDGLALRRLRERRRDVGRDPLGVGLVGDEDVPTSSVVNCARFA